MRRESGRNGRERAKEHPLGDRGVSVKKSHSEARFVSDLLRDWDEQLKVRTEEIKEGIARAGAGTQLGAYREGQASGLEYAQTAMRTALYGLQLKRIATRKKKV